MNRQEVKRILAFYRPGIDDPQFAEALEHVHGDPELARWFEQQCAVDAILREKLREIPVPDWLQEKILAERKIILPFAWWRKPAFVAAAAAAAVVLLLSIGLCRAALGRNDFASYRKKMAGLVSGEYEMNLKTRDLNQIREYLAKNRGHGDYVLAKALEQMPPEGCALLHWHGKPISLICFETGEGDENDLFLFIIDRSSLPDAPATAEPQFAKVGKMMTASWSVADKAYLLAGHRDPEALRKYL